LLTSCAVPETTRATVARRLRETVALWSVSGVVFKVGLRLPIERLHPRMHVCIRIAARLPTIPRAGFAGGVTRWLPSRYVTDLVARWESGGRAAGLIAAASRYQQVSYFKV